MPNRISADELGEAAESLFKGLCARAQLICNKSDRDRTGWDFIVEFPMPVPGGALALDQRQPTSCSVQLKATAVTGPVSLRLSAAERLAKALKPTFIVVVRMTEGGEPLHGYLIPLLGPGLYRVLNRLRIAEASRKHRVNTASISFDYRRLGVRFDLTPDGLRAALSNACGASAATYIAEKQRQLDELGYEDGGLEAQAMFWVEGPDHLAQIAMGLAPVRPVRFEAFDRRFGVRIPYTGDAFKDLDEFFIEPGLRLDCEISIRGRGLTTPAVFRADMIIAPKMEDGPDDLWLVIRHDEFTLTLRHGAGSFETTGNFDTRARTLDDWIRLIRGLCHCADGGTLTISFGRHRSSHLALPVTTELTGPYLDQLPAILKFLEGWREVLALAGISTSQVFNMDDIWAARPAALAVDLLIGPSRAWFGFDRADLDVPDGPIEAIYANSASFAGAALTYAVKVTLDVSASHPDEYRSIRFEALDAGPADRDLQDLAEEQAALQDIRMLIDPKNLTELRPEEV